MWKFRSLLLALLFIIIALELRGVPLSKTYTLDERLSQYGIGFSIKYPDNWELIEIYPQNIELLLQQETYLTSLIKLNAPNNETSIEIGVVYLKDAAEITLLEMKKRIADSPLPEKTILEQKEIILDDGHEALYTHFIGTSSITSNAKNRTVPQSILIGLAENSRFFMLIYGSPLNSLENFEKHKSAALATMKSFKFVQ